MHVVTKAMIAQLYPKRPPTAHKGDFGRLLVIGGSKVYSGSIALAALAAYRAGCDLVTIAAPERAATIAASFSPDLITIPLKGDALDKRHLPDILAAAEKNDAVVIGNGMGRHKDTEQFVMEFLKRIEKPMVIDADGLDVLSRHEELIKANFVLTPHAQEFFLLSNVEVQKMSTEQRIQIVQQALKGANATMLLKGNTDIISDGKQTFINTTGNPYMTVGGTGDSLAGICGALLARGTKPFAAACAAAYINGAAGDLAAKKWGEGLMASDVIAEIAQVIKT